MVTQHYVLKKRFITIKGKKILNKITKIFIYSHLQVKKINDCTDENIRNFI